MESDEELRDRMLRQAERQCQGIVDAAPNFGTAIVAAWMAGAKWMLMELQPDGEVLPE